MNDILKKCSKNTGYDEETVENVVTCFLDTIANKLCEEQAVDLGEDLGVFIIKEHTGKLKLRLKSYSIDCYIPFIGLLESLQIQVGCMYLSDLHIPSNLPLIQRIVRKIEPDSYGLKEWNDAVCYIIGQEVNFDSQRDAAKHLMNWNR